MQENMDLIRSPEVIAREINQIKTETFRFLQMAHASASRSAREIGRLLIEAKETVEAGRWGTWLKENVDYSEDTAQNLMRTYREFDPAKVPVFADLNYSQMVALFPLPPGEREALVNDTDVTKMSAREIKRLVKERDDACKRAEELEQAIASREDVQSLEKRLAAVSGTVNKAEMRATEQERRADKLQGELDELKAHPQVVEKIVNAPTAEELERIEKDAYSKAREEFQNKLETELTARAEKLSADNAKKEKSEDPRVIQVNVLLSQMQFLFDVLDENMTGLQVQDRELGSLLFEKLGVYFKQNLERFGVSVKVKK